ncbi:thioesterase family protein [Pseudoalteromonas sp. McH1-7]|nr:MULTISPECIES: acyl-CoA thioesterase [Pseudoalteromonas]MDW7549782.1 acyl-CoA thioesterase [Pseudoalteromonas peptidolytica]NLR16107.1 thioesterase [Pseudoalteromonas peptidolytica]NUZ11494.1 thioesterase family protein [Pseudoalteromonas sp. McH1-7]RRS08859.1 thioesterase [Pseudoalteromonas sp. J010]RXE99671.1 thioesterase [Pseudoalteromonas sp. PS5]
MNLYFRLLLLFWKIRKNQQHANSILDPIDITYRALPSDCDINMHLTNSRYLAFMDLARTWMTERVGLFAAVMKRRWFPIVNATAITYIRDIKPLQKFTITTKVVGWDHKYFYIEQRFHSSRGLHAIAYVRGVFKRKGGIVTIEEMLEIAGFKGEAPILSPEIMHWKAMLEAKKSSNL